MKEFESIERILSHTRKAVEEYSMIENGDVIAVGVSGGKDSLALLCALAKLKRVLGIDYKVVNIKKDFANQVEIEINKDFVVDYLKSSDYRWLLVIVALMVASFAIRGLVYYFFARLYTKKYSFIRCRI